MAKRADWSDLRGRRMAEPGAQSAYDAARLAHELGRSVRSLRELRAWSQSKLAREAGMTKSAVARFEAGELFPPFPYSIASPAPSTQTWSSR